MGVWPYIHRLSMPWSNELCDHLLAKFREIGLDPEPTHIWRWSNMMGQLAEVMPCEFAGAVNSWPKEIERAEARAAIDEFCSVIEFRRKLNRSVKTK